MADETKEAVVEHPKNLRDKAINIKGKQYVLIADRVIYFNEAYPEGSIVPEILSAPDAQLVVMKATVSPDQKRFFVGHSQAKWGDGYINKTSALENAETSAVGRALAFMGIGVLDSIASVDEINKANNTAAANGETKIAQHEKAFEQRAAAEQIPDWSAAAFLTTCAEMGKTPAQIEGWLKATFGISAPKELTNGQLPKALNWANNREPVVETLAKSLPPKPNGNGVKTTVSKLQGEENTVEIVGVVSAVEVAEKGDKKWLAIFMLDGMKISDWHLDHKATIEGRLGRQVTFLASVKGSGTKTYYNVDSLEVLA